MNILLSSIAKNDIRLLMRVFNAEKQNKGIDFLEELKECVNAISEKEKKRFQETLVETMQEFPVNIHYLFEDEEHILITAVFKI
ncbi:hypothetical protein [Chryseobacterium mucoviscidosis]|uniref:hypothetical protein n=1 Tax=Chryseobacterium mucoviscidosis TaxID=1945581 RepID=UPI0031D9D63C